MFPLSVAHWALGERHFGINAHVRGFELAKKIYDLRL
jgi:hypothetical protein